MIKSVFLVAYEEFCGESSNDCCELKGLKPIQNTLFLFFFFFSFSFKRKFSLVQPGNVVLNKDGKCELAPTGLDISPVFFP